MINNRKRASINKNECDAYKVENWDGEIAVYFEKNFRKDIKIYKTTSGAIKFIESCFYTSNEVKTDLITTINSWK